MTAKHKQWWQFEQNQPGRSGEGSFRATGCESIDRLYYPICNEAGMLSSVTPRLQGGGTIGQDAFAGYPMSAEDLPHVMVHRDFWMVFGRGKVFSLSGLSPKGLDPAQTKDPAEWQGGPGWFSLTRRDEAGRFEVRADVWSPSDLDAPVECLRVTVRNTSRRMLRFAPYAAVPLYARSADNLRDHRHVTALLHRTTLLNDGVEVCPTMLFDERGHHFNTRRFAVLATGPRGSRPTDIWGAQSDFLGEGGTYAAPQAVWNKQSAPKRSETELNGREAIGGFRFREATLKPGAQIQYLLVSGVAEERRAYPAWRTLKTAARAEKSWRSTKAYWRNKCADVEFQTPDAALNNWMTWITFQPMLRRIYGNSFLPEFDYGRGGKGWRDLWQDCLALLLYDPSSVRETLLHNFGGVRMDGSNATIIGAKGEFVADRNNIPRTWMDHGLWPLHTTLLYVNQTGDFDFLLKQRSYFRDPQIFRCRRRDDSWSEKDGNELKTKGGRVYQGTVLEHMLVQTVTAFFNVGEHNMCRLEGADWNDGMDMADERGESCAFTAFYAWNLERLAMWIERLAEQGQDKIAVLAEITTLLDRLPGEKRVGYGSWKARRKRLDAYLEKVSGRVSGRRIMIDAKALAKDLRAKARALTRSIEKNEWESLGKQGGCFNGYYDNNGKRVAGRNGRRVRMSLVSQVFPLMSGIASEEQVDTVIQTADRFLLDPEHGGMRLNTDYGACQPALGRAFSFNYGEKENGAVFSHMAVMYAAALYQRRRSEAGRAVWNGLYRMAMNQDVARIFPCLPEYFNAQGRGMYCYLTGSGSWMVYLMLTQVYGVRGDCGNLRLDPQLTAKDFGREKTTGVTTSFAGRRLRIRYQRSDRGEPRAVQGVSINGKPVEALSLDAQGALLERSLIEKLAKNAEHEVLVTLG